MKTSTHDKITGSVKVLKGKVKEVAGEATNNPRLREQGRDQQVEGKVQKKVGQIEQVFNQ
jgi:uncharacterized protein YjbJ (UPF0337 family)